MHDPASPAALFHAACELHQAGRLDEAERGYRQLLSCASRQADALHLLGVIQHQRGRLAAAEGLIRQALALREDASFLCNLGVLLKESRRWRDAEAAYRRGLQLEPEFVEIHHNLGVLWRETGALAQAEAAFRRALELRPDNAETRYNFSMALLGQGRYAEAWPSFENRYRYAYGARYSAAPELPYPQWQGEDLAGKSLSIWFEQGNGDVIQFARYVPLLRSRGVARLTLVCTPLLAPLLATLDGVDRVTDAACATRHDFWTLLLSLPLHFGSTLATIPAELPYLHAPPQRLAQWRARLPATGFRVGLAWQGRPTHPNDAQRSLPDISLLAPLWRVPDVSFVSLQKTQGEAAAKAPPGAQPMLDLGAELRDFADTAAIIIQLDLVICVDTAVAHLAGALGKPCWVLLPAVGTDWRWLRERSDSPWYPGAMRLFRQTRPDDWSETIDIVAAALESFAAPTSRKSSHD